MQISLHRQPGNSFQELSRLVREQRTFVGNPGRAHRLPESSCRQPDNVRGLPRRDVLLQINLCG